MKRVEKYIWMSVSGVLLAVTLVLLVSPRVFAQSRDSDSEYYLNLIDQVFRFVEENYVDEVDPKTLYEGAMKGLFESLDDPHSAYLSSEDLRKVNDTTTGEFGGVGIYINKQVKEEDEYGRTPPEYIEVVSPIEDTPAFRAGIRSGDLITAIEGNSTDEYSIDEVVDLLRGEPGTEVSISILRRETIKLNITLERAVIQIPTVKRDMIPGGIGFLRIIQFTPYTAARVEEAVEYFKRNNYTAMVIDVRSNPGGLLNSVIDTADLFFSGGLIVGTASRVASENETHLARRGKIVGDDIPLAVLINGGSASAAEILAGALKDRGRAVLFGETTYGKGSVQQIRGINDGGFRLTMSRYYTPSGEFIDKKGIVPDYEVKEAELTDKEEEEYTELLESDRTAQFVDENEKPTDREIDRFVEELKDEGYELREVIIRRLVRNEVNRRMDFPPVYNLDLDPVLRRAVDMIRSGDL
jgi:carboxyl-terminal processing protease